NNDAKKYWNEIHKLILDITGKNNIHWKQEKQKMFEMLKDQVIEQVKYWEGEKEKIEKLDHEVAVNELVKALKINEKISTIRKCL
ncbi:HindIII family type II restriction endonuclease, partial [bacterium]|nr:HindIII family type II restriction endonuclease [bacterium]